MFSRSPVSLALSRWRLNRTESLPRFAMAKAPNPRALRGATVHGAPMRIKRLVQHTNLRTRGLGWMREQRFRQEETNLLRRDFFSHHAPRPSCGDEIGLLCDAGPVPRAPLDISPSCSTAEVLPFHRSDARPFRSTGKARPPIASNTSRSSQKARVIYVPSRPAAGSGLPIWSFLLRAPTS